MRLLHYKTNNADCVFHLWTKMKVKNGYYIDQNQIFCFSLKPLPTTFKKSDCFCRTFASFLTQINVWIEVSFKRTNQERALKVFSKQTSRKVFFQDFPNVFRAFPLIYRHKHTHKIHTHTYTHTHTHTHIHIYTQSLSRLKLISVTYSSDIVC